MGSSNLLVLESSFKEPDQLGENAVPPKRRLQSALAR